MIVKILGILDIFIAIVFWLFGMFHIIPSNFILLLGMILLVKGLVFVFNLNITSILDIVSAVLIILATSINMPIIVIALITLFLLQKGVFSLMS
tara:strand:+ start:3905 stop:4186 length:282 start_codon:yes stop_codon:yes gene_type:complete